MIYLIVTLLALDQWLKLLAKKRLDYPRSLGVLKLAYVENRGAALGFLKKHPKFLKAFNTLVLVLVVYIFYMAHKRHEALMYQYALLFVIAGGGGNLMDRYLRGYVIDFFSSKHKKMPYFNMADMYIFIGVIMMVLSSMIYDITI